jgi:hypothetical protein
MVNRRFLPLAALLAACAGGRTQSGPDAPVPSAPLSAFATVRVIALPVQYLRTGDSLGWGAKVGEPKAYLARVDSALEAALRERGLETQWAFPSDLARTARRNPMHATSPSMIRAGDAVRVMERRRDAQIPEPVASQVRALAGFHDSRHAFVPVELRFERAPNGAGGRAVLHVAVLDVRLSQLVFSGDIAGPESAEPGADLPAELARRFANLIVER